jgi:uncharacterized protein YchJ
MRNFLNSMVKAAGFYRLAEVIYSIWSGKSLLALAVLAVGSTMIAEIAKGFNWADLDKFVLMAASIYAVLAFGWLATITAYRSISPRYKLVIPDFDFRCDPVPGTDTASAFQVVIKLLNTAQFPISYIVNELDFRIQNTVSSGQMSNQGAEIDAGMPASFWSGLVVFHHPVTLPAEGTLRVKISYGKPRKEKFSREASLNVRFVVDKNAPSGIRHEWTYRPNS